MSDQKHDENGDHDHEHDHAEEGGEEDDIVVFTDAEGNEMEFVWLGLVELDGESFALLTPAEEDEDDDSDQTEVYVFHYEQDEDGGETYSDVEDEALLARVQAAAEKMFEENDASEA